MTQLQGAAGRLRQRQNSFEFPKGYGETTMDSSGFLDFDPADKR